MDAHRTGRVSEAVREELSEIIGFEMADPRLSDVVVTDVQVSPDMRHAHVRIGVDAAGAPKKVLQALDHAAHYLRHELASRLDLRRTPELHFSIDDHPDAPERIEILLRRARKSRGKDS